MEEGASSVPVEAKLKNGEAEAAKIRRGRKLLDSAAFGRI
jgi:hypothetical protein